MFRTYLIQFFLIFVFACSGIQLLSAQNVKQLEEERKQTLQKLEATSKMLNETKKSQKSSLNKLTLINKNIGERKHLIKRMSTEISQLDVEMQSLSQEVRQLERRLENLKKDYAKLVQEAYINRSIYSKIMFVLSAETFDQSVRRLRYLKEYSDYRKQQVREIEKVKAQIEQKNDSISRHKNKLTEVVKQKEVETNKLSQEQKKEKIVLTDLQKKEKNLRKELNAQQKKANELNKRIEYLIAEEIRKAEQKKAAEERSRSGGKSSKSTTSKITTLTKEEALLSGNFEKNAGRLPWPVSNGFISGRYGVQPHPILKHVTTNNKGIYIQTPANSTARAVFDGVVTQRFSVPGSNNAVIIQHGEYRTVYANLTDIYVRIGEKVSTKQAVGKIFTDSEKDNKTELYFQIWKNKNLLNPEKWLAR
ncbi:MAG: peptidoglycan DD-metalloendopeptidase family protein [Bacteroidales bacterium]|nr:peptidoglycan DD-metalloendopeptidase family protein [Bacteroidales bacterium]